METMRPFLRTMQVQLDLREVELTEHQRGLFNTVKINGKKIEELLGEGSGHNCSPSSADLPGENPPCNVFHLGGVASEALTREMLVDAILKEAARFARSGCGCTPEDLFR